MVTNLMTVESIGFDQFVVRERSRWDRRHRRQSRDGKRRASREASEFQISCRGCRRLKGSRPKPTDYRQAQMQTKGTSKAAASRPLAAAQGSA